MPGVRLHLLRCFVTTFTVTGAAATASADSIWIGNAQNPIRADGVTVLRIDNSNLVFESLGGSDISKPLGEVQQLAVDNEPAFSAAEAAFRAGNHLQATQQYLAALQSSGRSWVRDRSAVRIAQDAPLTHRFDAAVSAYIYLVRFNPSAAVLPGVGDASPAMIAAAADELSKVTAPDAGSSSASAGAADGKPAASLSPPQQAALLRLGVSVFEAQGNTARVDAALQQIVSLKMATPFELARLELVRADAALTVHDFPAAADAVQQNRTAFVDPAQQVEALLVLARSSDGALADRHDTTALKDVAIAYMRVATFGSDLPDQPHVAAALLRVGQIEEELHEPAAAKDVYQQVVSRFPQDAAAATAKASLDRLGKPA